MANERKMRMTSKRRREGAEGGREKKEGGRKRREGAEGEREKKEV